MFYCLNVGVNELKIMFRYLTPGSYPVVAGVGEAFPPELWVDRGVAVYPVNLKSDEKPVVHTILAPVPGPWFMAGAIMEDSNRITQAVSTALVAKKDSCRIMQAVSTALVTMQDRQDHASSEYWIWRTVTGPCKQ